MRTARAARSVSRGFTLLEMLVVLVIIGLIAGLVGPRLFSKVDSSKVQTAGVQIKLLRGAVET
ncbi:MAG: prepilin-type N-terminal cleavage/methylation domain-containing protein, partial [Comamonadaceae bacterium]|nr:prepilin-type N-terminal cleavage/methylation domain-containing protein [Comamonadaceae bacterium]